MAAPRLLDLFCGAGGAAMGYSRAGFDVVGVDITPQPRFPFAFIQGDALEYCREHGQEFDAIHASPPCQAHSSSQVIRKRSHPQLIGATRAVLHATDKPYVIENVVGAPLVTPTLLCGSMFGLALSDGRGFLMRHRLFEGPRLNILTSPCQHPKGMRSVGVYGHTGKGSGGSGNHGWVVADWREVMGIDWMARDELAQAIPPAYTEYIGRQLMRAVAEPEDETGAVA